MNKNQLNHLFLHRMVRSLSLSRKSDCSLSRMSLPAGPLAAFAHAQEQQKKKKRGRPRKVLPPIVMPSGTPQTSKCKSPPQASSLPMEAPLVKPAPIEESVKADSLSDESDSANTSMDESSSIASTTDVDYSPPGGSPKNRLNKEGTKELLKAKLMTRAEKSNKRTSAGNKKGERKV